MAAVPKTPPRRSTASILLRLLWWIPASAVPFALFFGTLFGHSFSGYLEAFRMSLVFSASVHIAVMVVHYGVMPWVAQRRSRDLPVWIEAVVYGGTSIVASFIGALIVHLWIEPGFLGSWRNVAVIGLFALIFAILATALIYAVIFYRDSIARARSDQELNLARRIQRSFLIDVFPAGPRFDVHAMNLSSREVSGDFYDVISDGDGGQLLVIADVSGKGVPAALTTSMLQASVRTLAHETRSVAAIARSMNRLVCGSTASGHFATFFLARLDPSARRLAYCNAGHNPPLLLRSHGACETLMRGGTVLGVSEVLPFEEVEVALEPGDRLLCYTDGVVEAERRDRSQYGDDRLIALGGALPRDLPARECAERVVADVRAFLAGAEPQDDVTVLVLRVLDA